jgi:hypothetical protein
LEYSRYNEDNEIHALAIVISLFLIDFRVLFMGGCPKLARACMPPCQWLSGHPL